jgi:branched-chain amino acid transport system ATP-binding protein
MSHLQVKGLTKTFGGLSANQYIDLEVEQGQIIGLIGPNGAGKTTLFNCIAGVYVPDQGQILFNGQDITDWPPERICQAGLVRTFQVVKSFGNMTVLENVMVGAFLHHNLTGNARKAATEVLEKVGLDHRADTMAMNLTIADKKRLELARALATQPNFLMLDEAMAGLTPRETQEAIALVQALNAEGITILLVEHVMEVVMPISERIAVLDYGRKIAEGLPQEIARNEEVIKAYLGDSYRAES